VGSGSGPRGGRWMVGCVPVRRGLAALCGAVRGDSARSWRRWAGEQGRVAGRVDTDGWVQAACGLRFKLFQTILK
jgi:hypothetical protein